MKTDKVGSFCLRRARGGQAEPQKDAGDVKGRRGGGFVLQNCKVVWQVWAGCGGFGRVVPGCGACASLALPRGFVWKFGTHGEGGRGRNRVEEWERGRLGERGERQGARSRRGPPREMMIV